MKRLFLIISTIVLSCAFISVRAQDSSYQSTAPEDSPVYHTTDYIFYMENGIKWNKILNNGLTMGGTGFYFNIKQDTTLIDSIAQLESNNLTLSQELIEESNNFKKERIQNRIIVLIFIIFILIFISLFIKNRKLFVKKNDLIHELKMLEESLKRDTNITSNKNIGNIDTNITIINELKKQIEQLQLEISAIKNDKNLQQIALDESNTLKQQFEEKTSTIPNNSIGNTDELKKTINTNGEEITEEKKNGVVQYTQEHNSFSLYSDFIVNGIFNKVTETPNEDTIYELILDNGNGCSASVIIYQGAYSRILVNRSFIDGCEIQIVGKNEVCVEENGLAEKDNNGKWKLVKVPSIMIK